MGKRVPAQTGGATDAGVFRESLAPADLRRLASEHSPWMRLRRGRQQLQQRRFAEARATLESLVADHPEFVEARGWLGVLQSRAGMNRAAARSLASIATGPQATREMRNAFAVALCRGRRWNQLSAFLGAHGDELDPQWVHAGGSRPLDVAFAAARRIVAPAAQPQLGVVYHLPFCAGTSVTVGLSAVYGKALKVVPRKLGQHVLSQLHVEALRSADAPQVIRLHHPYPLDTGESASWVTTLREPMARFMSGFRKRLEPHRLPTLDFREAPSVAATIENAERFGLHDLMARELAILHPEMRSRHPLTSRRRPITVRFEEQLDYVWMTRDLPLDRLFALADEVLDQQFEVVGIVEHFEASYVAFGAAFGLHAMPDPTRTGRSDPSEHVADGAQLARIEQLHQVDTQLYDSWRRRFERRFGPALEPLAGEHHR